MKLAIRSYSIYLFLVGISAVYGGWAIVYTNVMNFPPDLLETTPFDSFVIPGLILAFVVGGTQFIAAYLLWVKNKFMYEAAAVAGFCLLIWMTTEVYMIPSHHPVQIVYLGFAMLTLMILMLLLKYQPNR
jgi:hypothetical protein